MKKIALIVTSLTVFIAFSLYFIPKKIVNSVPSTNVKDTLSSSQLSYFARVGAGVTGGDSIIRVNTAANPSRTTNNLFENDIVCIGSSTNLNVGCTNYTVSDIGNTAFFQIGSTITHLPATAGNYIVATRSAQHVITFTPKSTVTSGKWQFLIRATSTSGENNQDGMPDQNGFDIGSNVGTQTTGPGARLRSTDVACPWANMTVSGIGSTVGILSSNGTTYYYHTIICSLAAGDTNPIDSAATWTIGTTSAANGTQIINPSPNHVPASEGNADVYNFFIRHTDSSGVVIDGDTSRGQIAVVESVRVTATVDPSLSFLIDNIGTTNVGTELCIGHTLSANAAATTATQVPFGSLRLQSFNDMAQRVSATTNAPYGYVVTVYESAPMEMIGGSVTIPDTTCNSGCTKDSSGTWDDATLTPSRFGYSLTAVGSSEPDTMAFTTGANNQYKPFGIGPTNAVNIFSNTGTPTTWERSYVCYRIAVTNSQPAGNYETKIIYTATATF